MVLWWYPTEQPRRRNTRKRPLDPALAQLGIISVREREPLIVRVMRALYRPRVW